MIAAPAELAIRRWDDEMVVFDDRLGQTHHLPAAAAAVLETLIAAPDGLGDAALWQQLFADDLGLAGAASPSEQAAFAELLLDLQRRALIVALP